MLSAPRLLSMVPWAHLLTPADLELIRPGTSERFYPQGATVCPEGQLFDAWFGVISGMVKLRTVSPEGKEVVVAGMHAGGWFGERSIIRNKASSYDAVVTRDSVLVLIDRSTFMALFESSGAFNRLLVHHLNERLFHFAQVLEQGRNLDGTARVARGLAALFNPVLYPHANRQLDITQEEAGLLAGVSRPVANQALKALQRVGCLRVEYGRITVTDVQGLKRYGMAVTAPEPGRVAVCQVRCTWPREHQP